MLDFLREAYYDNNTIFFLGKTNNNINLRLITVGFYYSELSLHLIHLFFTNLLNESK